MGLVGSVGGCGVALSVRRTQSACREHDSHVSVPVESRHDIHLDGEEV